MTITPKIPQTTREVVLKQLAILYIRFSLKLLDNQLLRPYSMDVIQAIRYYLTNIRFGVMGKLILPSSPFKSL